VRRRYDHLKAAFKAKVIRKMLRLKRRSLMNGNDVIPWSNWSSMDDRRHGKSSGKSLENRNG